ncbi:glycoside hydrolase family 25 protein [Massilia glaciei]|uniref:Lysozyme n=1 Tax=Massilia glaciei TaxID=1524097 RepID=A0A2U2HIU9_9BURK|nr:glycoside hydrolase family 25 protein [Massilia glaciei]PWF46744.1 hypothetical protein C7C56_015635 [Massilia glaciei]
MDWPRVRAAGIDFCFVRAAYGDKADVNAKANLAAAKAVGITCGVYHFLRTSKDATAQVALMAALFDSLGIGAGDLPPVVDVEDNPAFDGPWNTANNGSYLAMVADWVATVRAKTGAAPVVYTRARFWRQLGSPTGFADCPLWVANDRPAPPDLPSTWNAFTFWQHSDSGTIDGMPGTANDMNYVMSDDAAALRALTLT